MICIVESSGVVGNFLLWERKQGIMVTYPIVIGGGGGTNLCSNSGGVGVIF